MTCPADIRQRSSRALFVALQKSDVWSRSDLNLSMGGSECTSAAAKPSSTAEARYGESQVVADVRVLLEALRQGETRQ